MFRSSKLLPSTFLASAALSITFCIILEINPLSHTPIDVRTFGFSTIHRIFLIPLLMVFALFLSYSPNFRIESNIALISTIFCPLGSLRSSIELIIVWTCFTIVLILSNPLLLNFCLPILAIGSIMLYMTSPILPFFNSRANCLPSPVAIEFIKVVISSNTLPSVNFMV